MSIKHSSISYIQAALRLKEIEDRQLRNALTNKMITELTPIVFFGTDDTLTGSSGAYDLTLNSGSSTHTANPYDASK